MKTSSPMLLVLLLAALLLAGCGKSAQQKQMETDLNTRVMQLHDSGMAKMRQAQTLDAQLDSALTLHDSVAGKFPKESTSHSSTDINDAKQKIASARAAMEGWMAGHKPYDENVKHEEAMSMLNADLQGIEKVSAQLDAAIVDATGTIDNHRKFAAGLLAKKPAKRGGR